MRQRGDLNSERRDAEMSIADRAAIDWRFVFDSVAEGGGLESGA